MALYKKYTDFETKQISKISHDIAQKYGKPKINHISVMIDDILHDSPVYNKKTVTIGALDRLFIKPRMDEKAIIVTRGIIAKHGNMMDRIIHKMNPPKNMVIHAEESRNCKRCGCIIL
jgi:hypothetical protein